MSNKKDTNFTHKRELRLNQESFYEMGNEQNINHHQPKGSAEQAVYIEQLQQQIAEFGQVMEEQRQELEEEKLAIETERQKAEEINELYLRARADVENSRRRARNEKEQALKFAVVPLLETLLPVLDNFERALQATDSADQHAQTLKEGVEMVYRHFLQVLSESGLSRIEAVGQPFDPHSHNAVMEVENTGIESGIVVEELQAGYRYLDRVIRPTMVKVSK